MKKPETVINSNGSKWAGEAPDSLDKLYEVLQTETLDPRFEANGDFVYRHVTEGRRGYLKFWGNFLTRSHVFDIDTNDPTVIDTLIALIKTNKAGKAYREAKANRGL